MSVVLLFCVCIWPTFGRLSLKAWREPAQCLRRGLTCWESVREFFDKKVAWPQSPGSGSKDTGTMIYWDGNTAYVSEIWFWFWQYGLDSGLWISMNRKTWSPMPLLLAIGTPKVRSEVIWFNQTMLTPASDLKSFSTNEWHWNIFFRGDTSR